MADILIRDVAPDVHERLKAQAAAEGQTLQAYLSGVLAHRARTVPLASLLREWAAAPILLRDAPSVVETLAEARDEREQELARRLGADGT